MRRTRAEKMCRLRKMVSDHRRTAHKILQRLRAERQARAHLHQVGNLRGREKRELAADHPIKKIYTKRFNTITQYLGRGTLDEQTAAMMKALAKSKLEKALQDNDYAQGSYAAEMEQAALLAEAKANRKQ